MLSAARPVALSVCLFLTVGVVACGGERAAPETYDWDRSATALVAARGTAGGFVPTIINFLEAETGSAFVRLYGDGTLYYGEPQAVLTRKLDEAGMQSLFNAMRPDLFADYKEHYNAANATDMPTTDIRVAVKTWGSHQVGIYGLGQGSGEGQSALPSTLLAAAKALADARQGGTPHTPSKLRLGAEKIDLAQHPKIDAAKLVEWPVASIDLATANIYQASSTVVSDAADVATILQALPAVGENYWSPTQETVFTQGGETYQVVWAVALP